MKNWISVQKHPIIAGTIGATLGVLYWYFIGCSSGNCGIASNWYSSMGAGLIMGYFLGDIAKNKNNKA